MRLGMGAGIRRGGKVPGISIAELYTDFSEYALGEQPSDWALITGGHDGYTVENKADAEGGKALRFTGSTTGDSYLRWDIDDLEDVLIDARVQTNNTASSSRIKILGRVGSDVTAYFYDMTKFSGYTTAIGKHIAGAYTTIDDDANANGWSSNTWYRLKLEIKGTQLRAKIWEDGGIEPDWLLAGSDSDISLGKVGISMRCGSDTYLHWVDWIRVTPL